METDKMKKIQPFSNGWEFDSWKSINCDKCCRYENKSTNANNARCRLSFYLDLASVSDGEISARVAEKIGYNGAELNMKCNDFNKPIKRYPRRYKNQLNIFERGEK